MSMTLDGTLGATFPDGMTEPPTATRSMVQLNTANGFGSTNTCIRRFTNITVNQGADITYADSAVNGASFTVNTNGVYAISYCDQFNAAFNVGLSLNSNQLSTTIQQITAANRLTTIVQAAGNQSVDCSWCGFIAAGGVIRAHNDPSGTTGTFNVAEFTIVRVS